MFGALFAIYWYLVPHTYWRGRDYYNVSGNINKLNVIVEEGDPWRPTPFPLPTDQCIIKLVNPCADSALDCSRSSIIGYGSQANVLKALTGSLRRIEYQENDDTGTVTIGMSTIYPFFPETWHNKMYLPPGSPSPSTPQQPMCVSYVTILPPKQCRFGLKLR